MRHAEDDAVLTAAPQLLGHLGRVGRLPLTDEGHSAAVIDITNPAGARQLSPPAIAHGITLSQAQHELARVRVAERGLEGHVHSELGDYRTIDGRYQKIASIGMSKHVGIDTYPDHFKKIRELLTDDGIFLNHGTRRAKRERRAFRRPSASRRIILTYIFPSAELDHIGHTFEVIEASSLEVHDVEGLRRHDARTCRLWYGALVTDPDTAGHVGPECYRMWLAYLAGVSIDFECGPLRIFQIVATKQRPDGKAPLPPTRADLYRG